MRFAALLLASAAAMTAVASGGCNRVACSSGEAACNDNVARNCVAGEYQTGWRSESCGARTCVVSNGPYPRALCALSAAAEPRCTPNDRAFCDGPMIVECLDGFAIEKQSCGSIADCIEQASRPAFCRTAAPDEARCTASSAVPDCTTAIGGCYRFDDGGCQSSFTSRCEDGLLHETLCASGQSCQGGRACKPVSPE